MGTSTKIVIIGGVAGGASAAAKARRTNEQAEIVLFERGPHVSFANCGLPYYVGGEITDRDSLLLQDATRFWNRFRVRVCTRHEVTAIDVATKRVEVKVLDTGEIFWETYDKLILAPGAGAVVPPWPGLPAPNAFTVKTVPDSDAIRQWIDGQKPQRAVVIGAGFIGLETAEALHRRGLHVTVVEAQQQILPIFDREMAELVERHVQHQGVDLVLGDPIAGFAPVSSLEKAQPGVIGQVLFRSGRVLETDMVILSVGVRPELFLAKQAGLAIGSENGIVVDEFQRTSNPDIYAAGDAVEVTELVTGRKQRIPLAGPANKQGRVAGDHAAGGTLQFAGALGTAIVEVLGITAAKTGLSAREAAAAGLKFQVTQTHPMDHASYYPGAEQMHIELVVEEGTARLLGGQIVGTKGVDKRIDVLATALYGRMTVHDLENLDLAYAPQFSSAKDPVILAGFVAANVARHEMVTISCAQLRTKMQDVQPIQLIDVRTVGEFQGGHLPGAISIPIDELRNRLGEIDPKLATVVYCKVGLRGYLAARILAQSGFGDVRNLTGGLMICPDGAAEKSAMTSA